MQREARSGFATSTGKECTLVLDFPGAGARREIARDAPPPFRFFEAGMTNDIFFENKVEKAGLVRYVIR